MFLGLPDASEGLLRIGHVCVPAASLALGKPLIEGWWIRKGGLGLGATATTTTHTHTPSWGPVTPLVTEIYEVGRQQIHCHFEHCKKLPLVSTLAVL